MIRNRQVKILLHLLQVKKTTSKELAKIFEVSVKTIQRDIDKLSTMGIPLTCKQGNQGGVYIDENYKLSKSFLSNEDLQSITFALSIYDSISKKNNKDCIMKKLALISPELIHLLEYNANEYFIADLSLEKVDMSEMIYQNINQCFDEEYHLMIVVEEKQMIVAPISYVLRSDGLYLYAFEENYLLIKISTISSSQIIEIEFERKFIPYQKNNDIALK